MPAPSPLIKAIRVTEDAMVIGIAKMVADCIRLSNKELADVVVTMGKAIDLTKMPKARMAKANVYVAEEAQQAVVAGWYSRLPRKTWLGGPKHLSGYLGRALADPYNTAATTDRVISFINTELLDREAPHWYRVNYGATGSRYSEGAKARRFAIQLNGSTLGSFTDDQRPDPVSWIPKKRFFDSDGNMFPRSKEVVHSPFGARAAHFFDLGYAVVAKQAPQAYDRLWRDYVREQGAEGVARLAKHEINILADFRATRTAWTYRVRST